MKRESREPEDKAWVVQLTLKAIERGAGMGDSKFLHLQIVLEEAARSRPFGWISMRTIAARMGKTLSTTRRIVGDWEAAGFGRRFHDGPGDPLVGIILFFRLDPKMPAASPDDFEAAAEDLRRARFGDASAPPKNERGRADEPRPKMSETPPKTERPPRPEMGEAPRPKLSTLTSNPLQEARSEESVSQSETDGLTGIPHQGGEGDEDAGGREMVRKVCEALDRLPQNFKDAAASAQIRRASKGRCRELALALVKVELSRKTADRRPTGYLNSVFNEVCRQVEDGTLDVEVEKRLAGVMEGRVMSRRMQAQSLVTPEWAFTCPGDIRKTVSALYQQCYELYGPQAERWLRVRLAELERSFLAEHRLADEVVARRRRNVEEAIAEVKVRHQKHLAKVPAAS